MTPVSRLWALVALLPALTGCGETAGGNSDGGATSADGGSDAGGSATDAGYCFALVP